MQVGTEAKRLMGAKIHRNVEEENVRYQVWAALVHEIDGAEL